MLLGSGEVVTELVRAGWLDPVMSEHRLVLYAYRHLENCVKRLESGEVPVIPEEAKRGGSCRMPKGDPVARGAAFSEQARGIINAKPLLLRPDEAALFVGSTSLLEEFRRGGWIKPMYDRHRLVLYSVRQLEACVGRLEVGEKPGAYDEPDSKPAQPKVSMMTQAIISPIFLRKARRTRRPMPVGV